MYINIVHYLNYYHPYLILYTIQTFKLGTVYFVCIGHGFSCILVFFFKKTATFNLFNRTKMIHFTIAINRRKTNYFVSEYDKNYLLQSKKNMKHKMHSIGPHIFNCYINLYICKIEKHSHIANRIQWDCTLK